SYRALAVKYFEAEIGDAQEPREKRHRAEKIVVRDRVHAVRSLEQREIVKQDAARQENRREAPQPEIWGIQNSRVAAEARGVNRQTQVAHVIQHEGCRLSICRIIAPNREMVSRAVAEGAR